MFPVVAGEPEPLLQHDLAMPRPIFSSKAPARPSCRLLVLTAAPQLPPPRVLAGSEPVLSALPEPLPRVPARLGRIWRRTSLSGSKIATSGRAIARSGTTRFATSMSRIILAVFGRKIPAGRPWRLLGPLPGPVMAPSEAGA